MNLPADVLACPRCDRTPLTPNDSGFRCDGCKVDFPILDGLPWLFAEPNAALGAWRGRLHFALQSRRAEIESLGTELDDESLRASTRARVEAYREALSTHVGALQQLLEPLQLATAATAVETYLALRTRLPPDHGLNTYYQNVFRDWSWGDNENAASLAQLRAVAGDEDLGDCLVLGAGAGRLAWDLHRQLTTGMTIALDFNPMLLLVAARMAAGETLALHEFPLAPRSADDAAVLRELRAPDATRAGLHFIAADALRPPVAAGRFDTVVTPWLIDVIDDDLGRLAARINRLLADGGRWINFGSLAFSDPRRGRRYAPDEVCEIVAEQGFTEPVVVEADIPYMSSPASRHGRIESVFTFAAARRQACPAPERYKALPDWLVTGKQPVPASDGFRQQAMSTQIHAFMMSLIDGRRSIEDMAKIMEDKRLMPRDDAVPALRQFFTRMFDDARRSGL